MSDRCRADCRPRVSSLAGPDRYLPAGLMRQGVGSTGRVLRQSDGPAAPLTTRPHPLHWHSGGNRGGEVCWDLGHGLGRRHCLVLGRGPHGGGEGRPGCALLPNLHLFPTSPWLPRSSTSSLPCACISSPRPFLRLPPTLCLLSVSEVPPSSRCGCLCVYLYISVSISFPAFLCL